MAKKDGRKKKEAETAVLNGHALEDVAGTPAAPALLPAAPVERVAEPPTPSGWSTGDLADAALVPLQVARSVLPTSRTPVALGVVALALIGVVDWPVAVGLGLGWEVLRRWGPEVPPR